MPGPDYGEGGTLPPGLGVVRNTSGEPERVQPSRKEQAEQIMDTWPACTTVHNSTAVPCTCPEACVNYVLRSAGFSPRELHELGLS